MVGWSRLRPTRPLDCKALTTTTGRQQKTYRVYHLTRLMVTFPTRDEALTFVEDRVTLGDDRDDFEILDQSDEAAS